jgi:hypothetical protein
MWRSTLFALARFSIDRRLRHAVVMNVKSTRDWNNLSLILLKIRHGNERQQEIYKIQEFKVETPTQHYCLTLYLMKVMLMGSQITVHSVTLRFADDVLLWEIKEDRLKNKPHKRRKGLENSDVKITCEKCIDIRIRLCRSVGYSILWMALVV